MLVALTSSPLLLVQQLAGLPKLFMQYAARAGLVSSRCVICR